ncbi:molybdate ABC transporter substrate-binding protein [Mucilaginibacter limnophilus]|uniref:molybdate ABC transporter substrate-binding protein n=1 Tax=Mucilaginibacter limnophilus TaxID=1932778 RepID=UPI001F0BAFE2|nr:molybdate ABC transporter substrate-binding protein [Mucilaginibacter limnophilus]
MTFKSPATAQQLRVAVAANLQGVIKALQADFKQRTGISAEVVTGSSGTLVAQINNGAPYDVFLSADMQFADALFKNGMATAQPRVYASGSLIICSTLHQSLKNWQKLLLSSQTKNIAIANPATAPYGKAAEEALSKAGVLDKVKSKIVYGESISQVNTYINTGVADIAFTSQSFVKDVPASLKLYWQQVPKKAYAPIEQGMVLLKRAQGNEAAKKFYQYILSSGAKRIFKKYGYNV